MGTMSDEVARDFFGRVSLAVRDLDVRVVLNCAPRAVPDPPAHVLVAERVPMVDLLSRMDAVVCHGGLNTVTESLANSLPLVLAPIRNDQPVVANQVVAAGAGVRVPFARVTPQQLRDALLTVLRDPALRAGAARARDSFPTEGGAVAAARHLADLATSVTPIRSRAAVERRVDK